MDQLPEEVCSSAVMQLERALKLLNECMQGDPTQPGWTWLQGACVLLQSSLDQLTRSAPCSATALLSATELLAKAGLCLASIPPADLRSEVIAVEQLIAEAHGRLSPYCPAD